MEDKIKLETITARFRVSVRTWGFWKPIVAVVIGALAGYLYYHFVGCKSGTCAITGNPWASTIWGGLLGLFFVKSPCMNGKC
ncbi:MAG: DUF6132 family protein [Bacteroidales bacterium]